MSISDYPLPATNSIAPAHPRSADIRSTYTFVLDAEHAALSHLEDRSLTKATINVYTMHVVCARVIGYLITEPLNETARTYVLNEVKSCHAKYGSSQEALYDSIYTLGHRYIHHFIRPFKKYKGPTSSPSGHISRPSFDRKQEYIKANIVSTPVNHSQSKANALVRDGYRCMVTGKYDLPSVSEIREVAMEFDQTSSDITTTNYCHIIPASTNMNLVGDKAEYAASVWTVMSNFGEPNMVNELRGADAHRLENILTLDHTIHNCFDELNLWFDKVNPSDPNDYRYFVRFTPALQLVFKKRMISRVVEFVNHAPTSIKLPLPDHRYLQLHATCARIAHLSGASEYLDRVFRDMERVSVLANDGSSANVLSNALCCLAKMEDH